MKLSTVAFLTLLMLLAMPNQAHAYLDPGTGSQVFQILIAVFVGAGFTAKIYWKKIKDLFRPGSGESDE